MLRFTLLSDYLNRIALMNDKIGSGSVSLYIVDEMEETVEDKRILQSLMKKGPSSVGNGKNSWFLPQHARKSLFNTFQHRNHTWFPV